MSPGRIKKEDGELLLAVHVSQLFEERRYEGGELSLEEFPPGVRATYRLAEENETGVSSIEARRRVLPGNTVPFEVETKKGKRRLIIESD
jgi:hypothetical protein